MTLSPVDSAVEARVGPRQRRDVGRVIRVNVGQGNLKTELSSIMSSPRTGILFLIRFNSGQD